MIDFQNANYIKLRQVSPDEFDKRILPLFVDGEHVVSAHKGIRDGVVFTNKRIICINIQGLTGKKTDYITLPYGKIQLFSVESAGIFDIDSELEIWFSNLGRVRFEFTGNSDIAAICRVISTFML